VGIFGILWGEMVAGTYREKGRMCEIEDEGYCNESDSTRKPPATLFEATYVFSQTFAAKHIYKGGKISVIKSGISPIFLFFMLIFEIS